MMIINYIGTFQTVFWIRWLLHLGAFITVAQLCLDRYYCKRNEPRNMLLHSFESLAFDILNFQVCCSKLETKSNRFVSSRKGNQHKFMLFFLRVLWISRNNVSTFTSQHACCLKLPHSRYMFDCSLLIKWTLFLNHNFSLWITKNLVWMKYSWLNEMTSCWKHRWRAHFLIWVISFKWINKYMKHI